MTRTLRTGARRAAHFTILLVASFSGVDLSGQMPDAPPNIAPADAPIFTPTLPERFLNTPFLTDIPEATSVALGQRLEMRVISTFPEIAMYQWFKDNQAIADATEQLYAVDGVTEDDAGEYHVAVTTAGDTVASSAAEFSVFPPARFANLSTRAEVLPGDDVLVAGFVVSGKGNKRLLFRAVGPTLAAAPFNVAGTLIDPSIRLFSDRDGLLAEHEDWQGFQDQAALNDATVASGAFLLHTGSGDAAAVENFEPGAYTIHVVGKGADTGVALVELFDSSDVNTSEARLVNISSRANVGSGDRALIPGLVVEGDAPKRVLVRAVGPSLARFGVTGFLDDPVLTVFEDGFPVGKNDNWNDFADGEALTEATEAAGAFALDPDSRDAAAIFTLAPGAYTVVVSGTTESTGAALVEVYSLDD